MQLWDPEILPIIGDNFYNCETCNTVLLKQKHVLAEVHFGPDQCIVVKPLQNLKNLIVRISDDTKIDLLKESE